jgi:hypothetical protein
MIWRTEKFLKEFYEKAVFQLPYSPQFRQFSFRYSDKEITPLRKTIRTPLDLKKYALQKLPIAIYCTRANFSQAKNLGAKKTNYSKNLFLGGEVVLDLDFKDFKTPEDCLKMLSWAGVSLKLRFLNNPFWVVASGRGFHIWIFDAFIPKLFFSDCRQKETEFRIFLSKLFKELAANGVTMGQNPSKEQKRTFLNTRQIFRIPGSINQNNGKVCEIIYPALLTRSGPSIPSEFNFEAANFSPSVINASPREKNPGGKVVSGYYPCPQVSKEPLPPVYNFEVAK